MGEGLPPGRNPITVCDTPLSSGDTPQRPGFYKDAFGRLSCLKKAGVLPPSRQGHPPTFRAALVQAGRHPLSLTGLPRCSPRGRRARRRRLLALSNSVGGEEHKADEQKAIKPIISYGLRAVGSKALRTSRYAKGSPLRTITVIPAAIGSMLQLR